MADQHTPVEVAVAFVEAFGRGDLAGAADRVAADIVFTSPRVTLTGAGPVLAAIGEFARLGHGVTITAALGDESQAMVMYEMATGPLAASTS